MISWSKEPFVRSASAFRLMTLSFWLSTSSMPWESRVFCSSPRPISGQLLVQISTWFFLFVYLSRLLRHHRTSLRSWWVRSVTYRDGIFDIKCPSLHWVWGRLRVWDSEADVTRRLHPIQPESHPGCTQTPFLIFKSQTRLHFTQNEQDFMTISIY